jgi:glutamyl-tRNA synthetase
VGVTDGPPPEAVAEAYRERARTLHEMAQASVFFYQTFEAYHEKAASQHLGAASLAVLEQLRDDLAALDPWTPESIHAVVTAVAESLGLKLGKVAQPLRVAVSGGPVSPPIDATVALLGRARTLERLDRAIAWSRAAG